MRPIGVSILTNSDRLEFLKGCIGTFLANCYFRPLIIGIHDNGSTDGTLDYLKNLPDVYGVTWRVHVSPQDIGCAKGTNRAIELVADCEYSLHIESDFHHLTPDESGVDKFWLHRAVQFMDSTECDYLYLRRMRDEREMVMHFWSQWMPGVTDERDEYLKRPGFWFSQNPHLRRNSALLESGTLPMIEFDDDHKGKPNWNQAEMKAPGPPNPWIHRWGVFVHEREHHETFSDSGCEKFGPFGSSGCKYGFWKQEDGWCKLCDWNKDFREMNAHEQRYRARM